MRSLLRSCLVLTVLTALLPTLAFAEPRVGIEVVAPAPVIVAPAPVFVAPGPVVVVDHRHHRRHWHPRAVIREERR